MEQSYWENFWRRPVSRRRLFQGVALGSAGLAAAAVIGCEEDEKAAEPTGSPGVAAEQPQRGGMITAVSFGIDAPTLDVHKTSFGPHGTAGLAYSRLVGYDLDKYPGEITFTGDLAENWEIPDPTTWVFNLRRGVKFQNIAPVNGRELKAGDIVYSYGRQKSEGVNVGIIRAIQKVEAVNDYTLRVTLQQPDADLLWSLADGRSPIIPSETVEVNGDLTNGPIVGTGAWIFEDWIPDQIVNLRRNPDFFDKGVDGQPLPYADRWRRFVILDDSTRQAAFRSGQILEVRTDPVVTKLLQQSIPDLQVQDARLFEVASMDHLWQSPTVGPTKDIRVRQAMSKLLNREAMLRDVYFGAGFLNAGIFMPSMDWHLPEAELKQSLAYDPQGARQLLSAAGVNPADWKLAFDYGTSTRVNPGSTEHYLAELKKLGITPTVKAVDRVEVTDRVYGRGETEICLCNNAPTRGINNHLFTFFHSSGRFASLFKQLADRAWDAAIEKQSATFDPNDRKSQVQAIQRKNIELAVAAPVATDFIQSAYNPKLRNFKNLPTEDKRWAVAWLKG